MIANYHTHTARCHHAAGTEEDYIRCAIDAGMKILGFADHSPQVFPGSYYSTIRMRPEELADYVQTLSQLKKRYEGQLQVHIGLEAEYYPAIFSELMALVRDAGVEYMILGQHWVGNEIGEVYLGRPTEDALLLSRYVDQVLQALDSGVFTYIAHPDVINFRGDPRTYQRHMRRLCRGASERRIPLEINLGGMRNGGHYPNPLFWELAAEEQCRVVLGVDAHQPEQLLDQDTQQKALLFADRFDLYPERVIALRSLG